MDQAPTKRGQKHNGTTRICDNVFNCVKQEKLSDRIRPFLEMDVL
jgi:hypothetical protein